MRSSGLSLLLLAALLASALAAVSYRGHQVYRLKPSEEHLAAVAALRGRMGLDFWSRAHLAGHPVDVRVPPQLLHSFRQHLDRHNVPHELLIADLEEVFQKERNLTHHKALPRRPESRISFTEYQTYDEIRQYLSDLASSYPSLVSVETIGQSFEGRPIDMIKISSGGDGTRPVIVIDAGIHAREWIAPAAALYVINQLVENAAESALTASVDWHIIPVLNPDGYEYTFTSERMWRKTRSTESNLCVGVDGNRNYDFHWMEVGASSFPCSETYAGPEAFSESETRALRDHVLADSSRIQLYLSFHSYGPYILYPWSYTAEMPDNWETLQALGDAANAAQEAAGGPTYAVGESTVILGASAGSSDDWTKALGGVELAYTIELPGGGSLGFDPPASEIIGIVAPFFEAIRVFGQYVSDNFG
ncbi:carboxypeptidase B-like isoform X2 [Schistocerca gregaria]|uniref:carboxypeptidase B-like isoform X2 n=1 Tax=Schistocerca gregaria TaxID=7010 RepID=UPI00211EC3CF|nr:carboxypeptidase B-like isoform X2 [Schistocerca gregaria]